MGERARGAGYARNVKVVSARETPCSARNLANGAGKNLVIWFRTDSHPFTCRVTCPFGVSLGKQFGYMY